MPRVLIVDDEPDILLMLRVNLEAEGYETSLAADGETALRRLTEDAPDLMVLDVMMPVMDGWAVLDTLRSNGSAPPVVVLSAKTSPPDMMRALELGASEYLTKPFDPTTLLETIARVLGQSAEARVAHRREMIERLAETE